VILKADISGLGEEGDIKEVANGYGRNFLLPKGFAILKTSANLKWLARQQQAIKQRKDEKAKDARGLAEKIADMSVTVHAKVSSGNRLYGSVHAQDIAAALKSLDLEIDPRKIEVGEPIKHLGDYSVTIRLYEGVQSKLQVHVLSDRDAAEKEPAGHQDAAPLPAAANKE
ncbi:MAG: 50S ribosomal protein L9, partial [Spirochaetota bacterium]|jgi:large subunit ribosomal protein L9|nr:50S ribosomal protein L9 [Spirochaetota bacterium]